MTPMPTDTGLRLLIPLAPGERSSPAVRHAVRRQQMGRAVEVCLLHVQEPLRQWDLLRSPWPEEKARRARIEADLAEAAAPLAAHGIPYAAYLRAGGVVFAILDAAEELDCHEIVVPLPASGWRKFFSHQVVQALWLRRRDIPVVTVAADGVALRPDRVA